MSDTPTISAIFVHDVPRRLFNSLPGQEERTQLNPNVNEYYWAKTVNLGACLIHVFCHEPPIPAAAPLTPLCYICKAPLELEHGMLCNDCYREQDEKEKADSDARRDERPT